MDTSLQDFMNGSNVLFLIWGAVLVFSMHAGFAFLEAGSVRKRSVVNAFTRIVTDWAATAIVYFFIGFPIAYGINFLGSAAEISSAQGFDLAHFFFLMAFAAVIPAVISGGIAERAKFYPYMIASAILIGTVYPFFESMVWGQLGTLGGADGFLAATFGAPFHDFAGSVVVHAVAGWIALPAILLLGPRLLRYREGKSTPLPVSSVPYIALGSWFLMIGWFGFNIASAVTLDAMSGLVAVNSLLAMVGGILVANFISKRDAVFIHNGALAGLVAICAGSDIVHPISALVIGGIGGAVFVKGFLYANEKWQIDDVLGVWPLHGLVGVWGGISAGIFGVTSMGGLGGVSLASQIIGTAAGAGIAFAGSYLIFGVIKRLAGLRLTPQEEQIGPDLIVHRSRAYPEQEMV